MSDRLITRANERSVNSDSGSSETTQGQRRLATGMSRHVALAPIEPAKTRASCQLRAGRARLVAMPAVLR